MLLGGALIGNFITIPLMLAFGEEAVTEWGVLITYPIMFFPPLLWAWLKNRNSMMWNKGFKLDNSNFAPLSGLCCFILVVVGTISLGFACDGLSSLLPPMPKRLEELLVSMTSGNFFINFICVSIMAPFLEEWLCRGMVLRGLLAHKVKPVWAIAFSAFYFAMIHLNPWQALPAFMLGLLFGYVYYKTGSLKLTILMHFTNNTLALLLGHVETLEGMESWMDLFGSYYWIFAAIALAFTALIVVAFSRVKLIRAIGNFDMLPSISEE